MKTESELAAYKNIKSDFVDYTSFEDDLTRRTVERDAFINNLKYTPDYKYPQLSFLIDDKEISTKKTQIYEAVLELEASKKYSNSDIAETELYARFHEEQLKKILLVEAARELSNPISTSSVDVNRDSFARLNEVLYGKFDTARYLGMVATEKDRLTDFNPKSELALTIKSKLDSLLGRIDVGDCKEEALLDETSLSKLHNYVTNRYADILGVVPNTSDDVFYNVTQCAEIINKALEAGDVAKHGWVAVENPAKSNPATNQTHLSIYLPSNTRRTAADLRRLIIHEQEVHIRRAQNGWESGHKPLRVGTADYADAEEGLGVLLECAVEGNFNNQSFDRSRNRYITAGLALGADGKPRDAREVYEILWRMTAVQEAGDSGDINEIDTIKAKDKAYTYVENAYRGTQFWMKGVIYTKLKVYYEGLAKNADFFKKNIDNLDAAFKDIFIGKYDHTDPTETELVKSLTSHI